MKIATANVLSFTDLSAVSTGDLLAFYNERTGKNLTKFASRARGKMQVWALIEAEVAAELNAVEADKAHELRAAFNAQQAAEAKATRPRTAPGRRRTHEHKTSIRIPACK